LCKARFLAQFNQFLAKEFTLARVNGFVHARILRALFACFQNAGRHDYACRVDFGACWPNERNVMESQQETTLAKVRLHWGIFIPVLFVIFALVVATLAFAFMANVTHNALSQVVVQFNQPPAVSRFHLILLLVWLPDALIVPGLLLATWFAYSKSEVILTNWRLVYRTGFLARRSGELPLENVESIFISEPLLGRVCGYGTVMVTTVGGARFPFAFISSPQSFHSTLQKAVESFKRAIQPVSTSPQAPPPQNDDSRYMPKG
jgi:hypothetical protein